MIRPERGRGEGEVWGVWGRSFKGMFFRFCVFDRYRVSTRGVGATAFPRQLVLLKKNYCIGMLRPRNLCNMSIALIEENYKKHTLERGEDRETECEERGKCGECGECGENFLQFFPPLPPFPPFPLSSNAQFPIPNSQFPH